MQPHAPTDWQYRVGIADASQRDAVIAVRRAAYLQAAQFAWKDEATLGWSAADERGAVLAVWGRDGALLSTARASAFATAAEVEAFLEYSLDGIALPVPAMVLSRVATAPEAARHGLFALLRYAFLAALPQAPVASLIAITYEGAPHVGSMRDAGYEFIEPKACWDSEAVPLARPLLALLPRPRFGRALDLRATDLAGRLDAVRIDAAAISAALRACR